MKINKIICLVITLLLCFLVGCVNESKDFFSESKIKAYGLQKIIPPVTSEDFLTKYGNKRAVSYANIENDQVCLDYVNNILLTFSENKDIKAFGFDDTKNPSSKERYIKKSMKATDYLINTQQYSNDKISNNTFIIYYAVGDIENEYDMYSFTVCTYLNEAGDLIKGYNLYSSITKLELNTYYYIEEEQE